MRYSLGDAAVQIQLPGRRQVDRCVRTQTCPGRQLEHTIADGGVARIGVGAAQGQRAGVGLDERTIAADSATQRLVSAAAILQRRAATNGYLSRVVAAVELAGAANPQRSLVNGGITGVRVGAGQGQCAGVGLDELAIAADDAAQDLVSAAAILQRRTGADGDVSRVVAAGELTGTADTQRSAADGGITGVRVDPYERLRSGARLDESDHARVVRCVDGTTTGSSNCATERVGPIIGSERQGVDPVQAMGVGNRPVAGERIDRDVVGSQVQYTRAVYSYIGRTPGPVANRIVGIAENSIADRQRAAEAAQAAGIHHLNPTSAIFRDVARAGDGRVKQPVVHGGDG